MGLPRHDTVSFRRDSEPSPSDWQTTAKRLPGFLRLLAGLAILGAVIGQFVFTAGRAAINPFNFFGYFTIQSNIITMVAFFAYAYFILGRKTQPTWAIYLRAIMTTIIVLVGLVYNTLLSGAPLAGSFDLAWSSNILHIIVPIYALVDWLLLPDRTKLPHRGLWLVLIYPLVWLVVILIRGATDGWVPYPFLDPATGYGSVTIHCIAISALTAVFALAVFALAVFALSRVRAQPGEHPRAVPSRRDVAAGKRPRGGSWASRRGALTPPRPGVSPAATKLETGSPTAARHGDRAQAEDGVQGFATSPSSCRKVGRAGR